MATPYTVADLARKGSLVKPWVDDIKGLDTTGHGGDAPEIMLRRVWGFTDEQYLLHANDDNRDVMCLQPRDFVSAEDILAHVETTVTDDLETLRQDEYTREFLRSAPEGLAYRVWIDNVRRDPESQTHATVFAFDREQLADFADTTLPGKSLLAKAWRDSTTMTTVARVCAPWFKRDAVQDQVAPA